jgi:hypothetical protein
VAASSQAWATQAIAHLGTPSELSNISKAIALACVVPQPWYSSAQA